MEFRYDPLNQVTFAGFSRTGNPPNFSFASTISYTYDVGARLTASASRRHGTSPAPSTIWRILSRRGFVVPQRHGQLLHVDWPAVKRMAAESRDYVVAKSGFKVPGI